MILDKQQLNQLYRYCYALTVDRDSAYDLLQTAMEKYLNKPAKKASTALPYIRKIIRNQFIDDARRSKRVVFEPIENIENIETIALDTMTLDNLMINEELADMTWSVLNTAEREMMFLYAIEGYTAAEIAIETDTPRGTVLSRIFRVRHKVIKAFKGYNIDMKQGGGE